MVIFANVIRFNVRKFTTVGISSPSLTPLLIFIYANQLLKEVFF